MNILQSSGIVSFDSYCYADVSLRVLIALLLKTRHFRTQLGQVFFKLKKLKVPIDQFSRSKRALVQKRAIFHLPCVKVGKAVKIV